MPSRTSEKGDKKVKPWTSSAEPGPRGGEPGVEGAKRPEAPALRAAGPGHLPSSLSCRLRKPQGDKAVGDLGGNSASAVGLQPTWLGHGREQSGLSPCELISFPGYGDSKDARGMRALWTLNGRCGQGKPSSSSVLLTKRSNSRCLDPSDHTADHGH